LVGESDFLLDVLETAAWTLRLRHLPQGRQHAWRQQNEESFARCHDSRCDAAE